MAAKTTTTEEPRDYVYLIIKTVAYGMFAAGLGLSVKHIFHLFHDDLHASLLTACFVPVFIDGFQLVGRLLRGERFASETRRTGAWLQGFGALVSLIANVWAGPTAGEKIGGVIFVVGYITIEAVAERIRSAADETRAADEAKAEVLAQAKRAADRQRRADRKAKAEQEAAARRERAAKARETRALAKQLEPAPAADHRNPIAYI